APRSIARPPTLIIKREHHIAGVVQRPGVVGQIEVLNSGITMAEHDACTSLTRAKVVRQIDISDELDTLAVERNRALHVRAPCCKLGWDSFGRDASATRWRN